MKKIFYILFFSLIFISFIGCEGNLSDKEKIILAPEKFTPQEYYDKVITHTIIKDSVGHTLIFHEVGSRGWRNYAFSIEHSPECELCCKIYD